MAILSTYKAHPDYNKFPAYNGNDLEVNYSPAQTFFRVWSPLAEAVMLRLYKTDHDKEHTLRQNMKRDVDGTWILLLRGDWKNFYYTFQTKTNDLWLAETAGIYAKAVGTNGERGVVINFDDTKPENWENDKRVECKHYTDAIIYEMHVRDISMHPESGIQFKGKFLGLTETNSHNSSGYSTGLKHIKELGITHVHIMPVYDFMSVDESYNPPKEYNWGYDPHNYNVPEGSYSTDAASGTKRILEFKQMIKAFHDAGIGVIMDMVYNHTGHTEKSHFNRLVPGYFYRFNWEGTYSNGSGCGNETASERPMVRKYILDSVLYWANEYHLDGFRFDLMGLHDIDTMNLIRSELDKISPQIITYGEGWTGGDSTLPCEQRAVKQNVRQLNRIAIFNDNIRDTIKGPWWNEHEKGFVSGKSGLNEFVKQGVTAATWHHQINYGYINKHNEAWADQPFQTINYVSCHDNHTLWDKLKLTCDKCSKTEMMKMHKLSAAIILTSQGIPFLHSGVELLRTKKGHGNSYNQPDAINQIDWTRKSKYFFIFNYFRDLIQLRKDHPAFRMPSTEMINEHLRFIETQHSNVVAYEIQNNANGDRWHRIIVIYNGSTDFATVTIPDNWWVKVADGESVNQRGIETIRGGRIKVLPLTMEIFVGE